MNGTELLDFVQKAADEGQPRVRVRYEDTDGVVVTYNNDAEDPADWIFLVKLGAHLVLDPEVGPVRTEWFRASQLTAAE